MSNKTILYVARAGLPCNAPGIRITRIGEMLNELGYAVQYICNLDWDTVYAEGLPAFDINTEEKSEIKIETPTGIYHYRTAQTEKPSKMKIAAAFYEIISAHRIFERVRRECEKSKPSCVILYNDTYGLTKQLIPFCRKRGIRLLADVTEWYAMEGKESVPEKTLCWLVDKRIRFLDKHLNGVIAISPFFKDYYAKLNVPTAWIPPLMECKTLFELNRSPQTFKADEKTIYLFYAGSPGNKDILQPVINAVKRINSNRIKVQFDLIGLSVSDMRNFDASCLTGTSGIVFHGRLSHEDTLLLLNKADLSVLLRHRARYAIAGFSTKISECMSEGVPVLCNRVGGSDTIIQDGENGYLIDGCSVDEIFEKLSEIYDMTLEQRQRVQMQALACAKTLFSKDTYQSQLLKLVRG